MSTKPHPAYSGSESHTNQHTEETKVPASEHVVTVTTTRFLQLYMMDQRSRS